MNSTLDHYTPPLLATAEEEAYAYILHNIRMGKYGAGDRLVPEDIAAEIGTSRMPVREAFRRLSTEGLVLIRPNRGATVRGLNMAEMEEVFGMRAVLEGLAGKLALPRIGSAELNELERLIDAMDRADNQPPQYITAHRAFHEYLSRLSGRPRLIAQIGTLHAVVEPHMRLWLQHATKAMSSRDDHMTIVDAISSNDATRVEAMIREHIEATIPAMGEWMVTKLEA